MTPAVTDRDVVNAVCVEDSKFTMAFDRERTAHASVVEVDAEA